MTYSNFEIFVTYGETSRHEKFLDGALMRDENKMISM